MSNRYYGSYRETFPDRTRRGNGSHMPRGVKRRVQHRKRVQADMRAEVTLPENRRQYRLAWLRIAYKTNQRDRMLMNSMYGKRSGEWFLGGHFHECF